MQMPIVKFLLLINSLYRITLQSAAAELFGFKEFRTPVTQQMVRNSLNPNNSTAAQGNSV